MSQTGPWSVKGIDQRAREAAREAASAEGMTLGEYLNKLLMTAESPQPNETPSPLRNHRPRPDTASTALDKLTRRIEATEARSTLAITGIDHTILGLVARLEEAEQNSAEVTGHVEDLIKELRDTHSALQSKVRRLEADKSAQENLEALKTLEQALGRLANHVYEESKLAESEAQAIKGRVETGFSELTERVEDVEVKVGTTLSETGSQIEQTGKRLDAVESDVSDALDSMETRVLRIHDRLNRAETTTDAALQSLESTFNHLDAKIDTLSKTVDPELANRLREEFEVRFEDVMVSVRKTVDTARLELAGEISRAAENHDGTALSELKSELNDVKQKLTTNENRQIRSLETVSSQIDRLSSSFDQRIHEVERRSDAAASEAVREEIGQIGDMVSGRIDELAEKIETRVNESEQRSASAISQIGDQVATVASRLQVRQDKALHTLATQIDENRKHADARLSDALSNVSERLEQLQSQSAASLTPIQKAMASLATRLESLEDFATPTFGDTAASPPETSTDKPDISAAIPQDATGPENSEPAFEPGLSFMEDDSTESPSGTDIETADTAPAYQAALPDFHAPEEPVAARNPYAEDEGPLEDIENDGEDDKDFDDFFSLLSDKIPGEEDAGDYNLAGLEDLDESHIETRDSDIFDDDEFDLDVSLESLEDADNRDATEEPALRDTPPEQLNDNYIAMARRAAISASGRKAPVPGAQSADPRLSRAEQTSNRIPLYAAASAVVITGAAVSGYLYLRGKQAPTAAITTTIPAEETSTPALSDIVEGVQPSFADVADTAEPTVIAEPNSSVEEPSETISEVPQPAATAIVSTQPESAPSYAPIPTVRTLEAAAATGDRIAQYQLAQDKLTAGDFQEGASLMRRSADKGLPIAEYTLSKLHEKGTGVPKDLSLSRQWTEKAAEGGNVKAMHDLAVFMAEGEGGPQTYAGAVEWFRKAADYGVVDSQYNLGVLYEQGLGISPNLTEALYWFTVAARNGDAGAPSRVMELTGRVSPEAAAQAKSRAAVWTASDSNAIANGRFSAQSWELSNPRTVKAVQTALMALGYEAGAPDGLMGPGTASAIRDYQTTSGLAPTGTVTQELVTHLNTSATGTL